MSGANSSISRHEKVISSALWKPNWLLL